MSGPFSLFLNGALRKILSTWGARLTWTAQRHHASQILNGMESFFANASFFCASDQDHVRGELGLHGIPTDLHPCVIPSQRGDISLSFNMEGVQMLGLNPTWHQNGVFGQFD